MKRNIDILSLPIISIQEGKEIGVVKDLIVETRLNAVSYVVFEREEENEEFQEYAIPFEAVEGIGDYALMIKSKELILDPRINDEPEEEVISFNKIIRKGNVVKVTSEIPLENGMENLTYDEILKFGEKSLELVPQEEKPSKIRQILDSRIGITSKKALTNKGRFVGIIEYYCIDEEDGSILEFVCVQGDGKEKRFVAKDIINIGEAVVILKDEMLGEKSSGGIIQMSSFAKKDNKVEEALEKLEKKLASSPTVAPVVNQESHEVSAPNPVAGDFSAHFKKNLIGKKITKDLKDEAGNIYLYKGTEISKEMLDEIESMGKASLMELFFVV